MNHLTVLDGSIVGLYLLATMIAGLAVRRYVGKVEHFLVAGREMDVYLGVASLAATEFGIVTCMYTAQNGFQKGFAGAVPGILMAAAMWLVGWTGFCIKPLRLAGVMTIPELFERRFGPRIRWLSGVVIVFGGLLTMGMFLRVGGDFLVCVCRLRPEYLEITMTALLAMVAVYTILGGMLSVLITDFLQFVVMSAGLILVTLVILKRVGWAAIVGAVESHYQAGGFNPFVNPDVGWPYIIFQALGNFAVVLTWQTIIQRVLASRDARTARHVYTRTSFFFVCRFIIPGIWGMAALATLSPASLTALVSPADLASMTPAQIQDRTSLLAMPHMLSEVVPAGLMGLLLAAMLAADMSTDSSYMLTWAGIIYNDILAPFRGGWSDRKGILVNRVIVALIGVFLLLYGLWYPMKGDLWTYLTVASTIYVSSMSVLLIACCYWKGANSWGAGAAIALGAIVPLGFLLMQMIPATEKWAEVVGPNYSGIATYVIVAMAMVIGSWLKPGGRAPP
jgi:SSS family solute:Na+ symporter